MRALLAIEAELDRSRQLLLAAAHSVNDGLLHARPAAEEWSVAEILHHLVIVEQRIADRVAQGIAVARQNGWGADADDPDVVHSIDGFQVERVITPIQTRNPPEPGHSRVELFAGLQASREKLLAVIRAGRDVSWSRITAPHPALGELNLYQWLMFVARHEDRHRVQLERAHARLQESP
jgi:uncharacterized damage-inducible protein DinB